MMCVILLNGKGEGEIFSKFGFLGSQKVDLCFKYWYIRSFWDFNHIIHPGRLTWNQKITQLKRKIIFQTSMIMFHVNLPGCKSILVLKSWVLTMTSWVPILSTSNNNSDRWNSSFIWLGMISLPSCQSPPGWLATFLGSESRTEPSFATVGVWTQAINTCLVRDP